MVLNFTEYRKNSIQKINLAEEIIYEYFLECEKLSNLEKNNIILLFYHELIYFYTTTIARNEILRYRKNKKKLSKEKLFEFMNNEIRFGWRNENNLFNQIKNKEKISFKRRLLSIIFSINFFKLKNKHLYIGDLSINNLSIIFRAFIRGYKIKYIKHDRVYIDNLNSQSKLFFRLIDKIDQKIDLDYDKKKLKCDIQSSLKSILIDDINKITKYKKCDIIIIGSPAKFNNRIASINGYALGTNVIGVLHSDESGSNSLPSWQFDDRSLSHSLIGYGPGGNYYKNKEEIFLSIDKLNQNYIESDSEFVSNNYKTETINTLNDTNNKKGLYISLQINNISLINSDDIIDLKDYVEWQNFLLDNKSNIEIKIHPKQKKDNIKYKANKIYGNLIDCIDEYDFFVLDYLGSTAFAQIAATNKPIIYYNIGLCNYTKAGLTSIKNRVIWCNVDIYNNYEGFFEHSIDNTKKTNSFSKSFSLSTKKISRIDALFNTIETIQKIIK